MLYALKFDWKPTDKFWVAGMGYWQQGDGKASEDLRVNTYGAAAGFKFTPAVELKGIYYWQTYSGWDKIKNGDNAKSWKAILDVKQDALKFTSLWVEYAQEDNWFGGNNDQDWVAKYSLGTYLETGVLNVRPHNADGATKNSPEGNDVGVPCSAETKPSQNTTSVGRRYGYSPETPRRV